MLAAARKLLFALSADIVSHTGLEVEGVMAARADFHDSRLKAGILVTLGAMSVVQDGITCADSVVSSSSEKIG